MCTKTGIERIPTRTAAYAMFSWVAAIVLLRGPSNMCRLNELATYGQITGTGTLTETQKGP